jgi:hypothetical protein
LYPEFNVGAPESDALRIWSDSAGPCATAIACITIRIYVVRYEWDEEKNRQNQRKHGGISFELAALVFEDKRCLIGPDRVDKTGEQRWHGHRQGSH